MPETERRDRVLQLRTHLHAHVHGALRHRRPASASGVRSPVWRAAEPLEPRPRAVRGRRPAGRLARRPLEPGRHDGDLLHRDRRRRHRHRSCRRSGHDLRGAHHDRPVRRHLPPGRHRLDRRLGAQAGHEPRHQRCLRQRRQFPGAGVRRGDDRLLLLASSLSDPRGRGRAGRARTAHCLAARVGRRRQNRPGVAAGDGSRRRFTACSSC